MTDKYLSHNKILNTRDFQYVIEKKLLRRNRIEKLKRVSRFNDLHKKINNKFPEYLIDKSQFSDKYDGVYHYHIKKTGGTSLNMSFISLNSDNALDSYTSIISDKEHKQLLGRKKYIGWNYPILDKEDFFYAWSHAPYSKVKLRQNIFTFTIFREPSERIISLYKHIIFLRENGASGPTEFKEISWLGDGFSDFLKNLPKENLLRQLYMFSNKYDVNEAVKNVDKLSYYFFTENLSQGIKYLNKNLNIKLDKYYIRKSELIFNPTKVEKIRLKKMLKKEYQFYNQLRNK